MDKKQCNDFNRILSSVKIFLNGFNLILEEKKDYTEPLGLLIFDKNVKAVGTLCYNKPLIYITAKLDNDTTLHACCKKIRNILLIHFVEWIILSIILKIVNF